MKRAQDLQKFILRHLLLRGRATRPELVALTGRRAATVFAAVDELKELGLVAEPDRRGRKTGRRAPELECRSDHAMFAGIDVTRDGVFGVITDFRGRVTAKCEVEKHGSAADGIGAALELLRARSGGKIPELRGIGVSASEGGLPDAKTLSNRFGTGTEVWKKQVVLTRMEYLTRLPDVPESLLMLNTDDMRCGFIRDGRMFPSPAGMDMELGAVPVTPDGAELIRVADRYGIADAVRREISGGAESILAEENFSLRSFARHAHTDRVAYRVAGEAAAYIGRALAAAVALLTPELVVLGGELSGLGDILLDAVRRETDAHCPIAARQHLRIELSMLESGETAHGAAMMMRDKLYGIEIVS